MAYHVQTTVPLWACGLVKIFLSTFASRKKSPTFGAHTTSFSSVIVQSGDALFGEISRIILYTGHHQPPCLTKKYVVARPIPHIGPTNSFQHTFETADAGAAMTYPMQCSALRKNGHVVIKQRPCKIVDMSTSKTGKHGHAKVHMVAIDIFTGKKLEDLSPSTHNMEVPNVSRREYQLLDIDDGFLSLMTADGDTKDDVKIPDGEVGDKIQAEFDEGKDLLVTIISAMGEEACISYKEAPKGA